MPDCPDCNLQPTDLSDIFGRLVALGEIPLYRVGSEETGTLAGVPGLFVEYYTDAYFSPGSGRWNFVKTVIGEEWQFVTWRRTECSYTTPEDWKRPNIHKYRDVDHMYVSLTYNDARYAGNLVQADERDIWTRSAWSVGYSALIWFHQQWFLNQGEIPDLYYYDQCGIYLNFSVCVLRYFIPLLYEPPPPILPFIPIPFLPPFVPVAGGMGGQLESRGSPLTISPIESIAESSSDSSIRRDDTEGE